MPRLRFDNVLPIYRNTQFAADGQYGVLKVASDDVLETLRWIDKDDDALQDSGVRVKDDPKTLDIGASVDVEFGPPRLAIGRLVPDLDALLKTPQARTVEPPAYFLFGEGYASGGPNSPALLRPYRRVIKLAALLAQAAASFDQSRQELLFIVDGERVPVSVLYTADHLAQIDEMALNGLDVVFADEVHRDQKLEILGTSVAHLVQAQPAAERFGYLLKNLASLHTEIANGYRLFVSSFSYAKVRSELESARLDFIIRIHKTFVDIQGQLLGIPVATFVVAAQMKGADKCSPETWMDAAVLVGAGIFFVLLLMAIANQWLTLGAINAEIERQKKKVARDFASASALFEDVFAKLAERTLLYRCAFVGVGLLGLAGVVFATWAYGHVTKGDTLPCLTGKIPIAFAPKGA